LDVGFKVTYQPGHRGLELRDDGLLYEAVLNILGSTGTIIPVGDPKHGEMSAATFKTVGAEQVTFTPSEPISDWDTKRGAKNGIPVVTFNGTDEEADSPDAAYWSRALAVMSLGVWARLDTTGTFMAKFDAAGDTREWIWTVDGANKAKLTLYDENDASNSIIESKIDAAISTSVWTFLVATYDGTANATGINVYQDGALPAHTDTDQAGFASMRDTGGTVQLGHHSASPGDLLDGKMAGGPLGPFFAQKELNADEVLRLYEIGRRALNL
tara:strand:+ start:644 stop:1453 length:810 start_codon:yes stop_codon:yes gene_type:complete